MLQWPLHKADSNRTGSRGRRRYDLGRNVPARRLGPCQGAPPACCTQRPCCLQGGLEATAYPRAALCCPCRRTVTPASRLCWMHPCWGWGPERLADTPQQEGGGCPALTDDTALLEQVIRGV